MGEKGWGGSHWREQHACKVVKETAVKVQHPQVQGQEEGEPRWAYLPGSAYANLHGTRAHPIVVPPSEKGPQV